MLNVHPINSLSTEILEMIFKFHMLDQGIKDHLVIMPSLELTPNPAVLYICRLWRNVILSSCYGDVVNFGCWPVKNTTYNDFSSS